MNISEDYKKRLEQAGQANPWTPERIAQLRDAVNYKIAKDGEANVNPDVVEIAKFLNSVEGSAFDFAMQGASFGFSDEILGNLSSLPSNFATGVERFGMETYANKKPIKAALSEVGGAILPAFIRGPKKTKANFTPQTKSTIGKVIASTKDFFNPTLTGAVRSGTYGTIYGLGKEQGTAKERLGKYQPYINGLASAVLSYPVRVLSRGTNAIVDSFADMPSASEGRALAVQEVRDALMQDHGSIEEALAAAHKAMGTDKQLTAADLGPNSRGTLELVNMIPGIGRKNAIDFLKAREEGRYGRIVSDLQEAFGPDADYYVSYKAIEDSKKALATDQYNKAFLQTFTDGTVEPRIIELNDEFAVQKFGKDYNEYFTLNDLLHRPSMKKALVRATEIAAEDGIDLPLVEMTKNGLVIQEGPNKGKMVEGITYQFAHYLKLGLDDLVSVSSSPLRQETSMGPVQVGKLMDTKSKFVAALDTNEDYELARNTFAGMAAVQDAMDLGRDIFKKNAPNPEQLMESFGKGEQEAYRLGVFQAIFDKVESGSTSRDLAKLVFNSERNKRLIRSTFPVGEAGDAMFDKFFENMALEMDTRATEITVQGGSATAQRQERLKRFREKSLRQITSYELSPRNVLNQALSIDFENLNNEQMAAASEKIAEILTETEYDNLVKKLQGGKTLGQAISETNAFKIPKILKAIVGVPDSPYVIGDIVSQVSDEIDEAMNIEEIAPELIDQAKLLFLEEEERPNLQGRVDNFSRTTPTSVSERVMPTQKENLATQLDNMLASFQPSNIPLVPPATAVTPESMLSETILPNPRDREILERRMRGSGIGSLA